MTACYAGKAFYHFSDFHAFNQFFDPAVIAFATAVKLDGYGTFEKDAKVKKYEDTKNELIPYAEFYSGLFWSSTQYLPFPACAYVFRSRYPYTSCTLGPITRNAGFPVRPVKQ